jgi:hypothetical protein
MSYELKVFVNQLEIVKRFINHLVYHRVIRTLYIERQMQNEFWTLTSDAHLIRATINWCMVFGTDSNPTHWKRLSSNKYEQFRDGFLVNLGISSDQWLQDWTSMRDFRDKYAAHRELDFDSPVPNFDTALKVAFYYDDWVRKLISPDTIEDPALVSFARSLEKSAVPFIEKLMEAAEN